MIRPGPLFLRAFIGYVFLFAISEDFTQASTLQEPKHQRVAQAFGALPLRFEANRGQTDGRAQYVSRGSGYTLFLTGAEAMLVLRRPGEPAATPAVLRLALEAADGQAQLTGLCALPGRSQYFLGHDSLRWRVDVPQYAEVRAAAVYPGVDLVYYGNQQQLESDFILAPGADPRAIAWRLNGAQRLRLNTRGDLLLNVPGGQVVLHAPSIYQKYKGTKIARNGRYVLRGPNTVGFEIGSYDRARALIIDPVLSYATYLGGSGTDSANAIAIDSSGNIYIAGTTASADFPTADSSGNFAGQTDAFVAKISADGSSLLYSAYLGGSAADEARGLAVDSAGNAYIAGATHSADFPTRNALQPFCSRDASGTCSGDAFVAKFDAQGGLVYSTYLGGSANDVANAIAVDGSGNAYIAGTTNSTNFPVVSALQWTAGGNGDAFLAKIAADGSHVIYATYLGGSGADEARGVAVDAADKAYVTGRTRSFNFPTQAALQANCTLDATNVCTDAFVAKVASDGSALVYSTYLGGSGADTGNAIAADGAGSAYVVGETLSSDFPLAKPLQAASGGSSEAFVSKLAPDGSSLLYSTYLGGSGDDCGYAITVDSGGNAFVAGGTHSPDFPLKDSVQAACKRDASGVCSEDAFVAVLDPTGATLEFATYLGGSGADEGRGIAVDAQGTVYVAGATTSPDFPSAKPAQFPSSAVGDLSASANSGSASATSGDAFVAKITGLSVVSGTGAKKTTARAAAITSCSGTTTNWLGGTGNWSDSTKWSAGVVPNSGVSVCIDNGNAVVSQVTLDISVSVSNITIDSDDSLIIGNNITLVVGGSIANAGQISANAGANNTVLQIAGGRNVSLTGGGTVTMSTSGAGVVVINQTSGGATLTNVDNTIQGQGQIGNNGLALVNQGTIDANAAGALLINSAGVTNSGLLEATSGGTLQVATAVNNLGGTITSTGSGSSAQFFNGTNIQGGTLNSSNSGVLGTAAGNSITLDGSTHGTLTNAGTYTAANNSATVLVGTMNNAGEILLNAAANNVFLQIQGGQNVSLTGTGTVTLSTSGIGAAIINQTSGGSILTNVNNVIQGQGEIGNNGLVLVNQVGGTINANAAGPLTVDAPTVTNQHVLQATGGGTLAVNSSTVNNNGGTILANGGTVQFASTTIQGGTLNTLNSGVLGTAAGQAVTLDGLVSHQGTLTNTGTYTAANNSATVLLGTINNTGAIQINAAANTTSLQIAGGQNVTLMGGGVVTMSTSGLAIINQTSGGATLTNVDNTIQGAGQIGSNGLALVNQSGGIINANAVTALVINPSGVTNQGLLEATSGGTLQLSNSSINNKNGTIKADGANSLVQFVNGAAIQSGTVATANGGILGTAAGNSITLDGSTQGQQLTIAGTYTAANNSTTVLFGTIDNTGAILLSAAANNTVLQIQGGQNVNLSGGGTLTMSTSGVGVAIINQRSGGSTLTNANNTIQGQGEIGNNGLALVNAGTINANVLGGALTVDASAPTNTGTLEATNGGILALSNSTINNQGGTIKVDGAASSVQFVNGAVIQGGTLTTANSGVLGTAAGTITLDGSTHGTLTNAGTYTAANNSTTVLFGTINNPGTILLNAAANNTVLQIQGGQNVNLSGGGTLTMSTSGVGVAIINQSSGGSTLTNANNTIQGQGEIGNNGLVLVNAGTINAGVLGGALTVDASAPTNTGTLEATSGGILALSSSIINNKNGIIKVDGAGSLVQLVNGVTIQSGTLATANGGVLGTEAGHSITLNGSSQGQQLTIVGTYTAANSSTTVLVGTINNTGAIQINAAANSAVLQIAGGQNVSLTGGGTLTLATSGAGGAIINQASGGSTLTNVDNTIQGRGEIGNNGLALVNQAGGTINANAAGPLTVDAPTVNQHVMQATGGGTLAVNSSTVVNNGGTILANGGTVQFASTTIQGGTLNTLNGGVLGTAAGQTVTLDGLPSHQGTLTNAGTYTGANASTTVLVGTINNTGATLLNAAANNALLQIQGGQNVSLTGGGTLTLATSGVGGAIINQTSGGSTLTNVGNTIQGTGEIGNNGLALVNNGTLLANATSPLVIDPASFTNSGAVQANSGSALNVSSGNSLMTNAGNVVVNTGGTMNLAAGLNYTQTAGGTKVDGAFTGGPGAVVNINAGMVFGNGGTITAPTHLAGVLSPGDLAGTAGLLSINGTYSQAALDAYNVDIGGLVAGSQFDQVDITNSASLNGTLNATLINGFNPSPGNSFTVMTYGSHSGTFATTNLPSLTGGNTWQISYNATSVVLTVVAPAPVIDLALTKSHVGSFTVGVNGVYSLTVTNVGNSATSGTITLTDTLPIGLGFVSGTGTGWSCLANLQVVTCTNAGPIAGNNGASALTLTVSVGAAAVPSVTNTATVSTSGDNNAANNAASDPTTVNPAAGADIAVAAAGAPSPVGGFPAYAATVTNNGPADATNVVLTDLLDNYGFVSASSTQGSCTFAASTVTCTLGTLTSGASAIVTVVVIAPNSGWAANTYHAGATQPDPNPINNSVRLGPSLDSFNTPVGSNVAVNTSDPADNLLASLIFANVTRIGSTTMASMSAASLPAGFRSGRQPTFFDISTNAEFVGAISLNIHFLPANFRHPALVRLFHFEGGVWMDRTTGLNVASSVIAGQVMSLSPFVLVEPLDSIPVANAGADRSVPGAMAAGARVTLDGSASTDADGDPLTYRWSGPFPEGGGTVTGINPTVTLPLGVSKVSLVVNDGEADSPAVSLNLAVADFQVSAPAGSVALARGQSTTFAITMTPQYGAFGAPITLSCAPGAAEVTCAFSSASVTPGATASTATLTVTAAAMVTRAPGRSMPAYFAMWFGALPVFGVVLLAAGRRKKWQMVVLLMLLLVLVAAHIGCGGGGTTQTQSSPPPGTKAVTITVTGTSGTLQHSSSVTVTIPQ